MNQEKFVKAVTDRANERVQQRIKQLISSIDGALRIFGDNRYGYCTDGEAGREIITILANRKADRRWPKELWQLEEGKVQKEIFDMFDPLQKALNAPGPQESDEISEG
jgi:hypothetical protein